MNEVKSLDSKAMSTIFKLLILFVDTRRRVVMIRDGLDRDYLDRAGAVRCVSWRLHLDVVKRMQMYLICCCVVYYTYNECGQEAVLLRGLFLHAANKKYNACCSVFFIIRFQTYIRLSFSFSPA